jgi:hypothetical protein
MKEPLEQKLVICRVPPLLIWGSEIKKAQPFISPVFCGVIWLRGVDVNHQPLGYE